MCEGKDFKELIFHDNSYGNFRPVVDAELNASFQILKEIIVLYLPITFTTLTLVIIKQSMVQIIALLQVILILMYQTFPVIALME